MDVQHQNSTKPTLEELQRRIQVLEGRGASVERPTVSTGCALLDQLFPDIGIRKGSLVEWISNGEASCAGTLSLFVGQQLSIRGRSTIIVDVQHQIFVTALVAMGCDLTKLFLIRPTSEREALWACEESLRCVAVDWVWARMDTVSETSFRRLQLAVEASGAVGFFVRPAKALRQSSWADIRLLVSLVPSRCEAPRCRVEVAYSRGPTSRSVAEVTIDPVRGKLYDAACSNQTYPLSLVS